MGRTGTWGLCCTNSLSPEGEGGGVAWSPPGFSGASLWPLITGPSSSRLFSLQVPVPPKMFLSLVYKLEGSSNVRVALELTTGDAGSCHVGGISALNGEGTGLAPAFLPGLSPSRDTSRRSPGYSGSWCWQCRALLPLRLVAPPWSSSGQEVHFSVKNSGP